MRPSTNLEIRVGLLVLAGVIATVGLVLASDRVSFERSYPIGIYLPDAGGLRNGSPVTLSGIQIGEVDGIASVSDTRGSIRVKALIRQSQTLPGDSMVRIATSGIFGDSSLAFNSAGNPSGGALAKDGSAELKASPGLLDNLSDQAQTLLSSFNDALDPDTRSDAKRLVKNAADFAGEGARLARALSEQNERIGAALDSVRRVGDGLHVQVESLSTRAGAAIERIDRLAQRLDEGSAALVARAEATAAKLDGALDQGTALMARGDQVLAAAGPQLGGDLRDTLAGLRDLAGRLAAVATSLTDGDGVIGQLLVNRDLAKDLNAIAVDAASAARQIADEPSTLVFGQTGRVQAREEARRARDKMRRALAEGFRGAPADAAPAP